MPNGIGLDASSIRGYTDVARQNDTWALAARYSYYISPYWPVIIEVQHGILSGGSIITDEYRRWYVNHYYSAILRSDLQLGQVVNYENNDLLGFLKNLY